MQTNARKECQGFNAITLILSGNTLNELFSPLFHMFDPFLLALRDNNVHDALLYYV